MEWVEVVAATVAAAKDAALEQLGVGEEDAEIVVVEVPRSGLFGLRRGQARVRARVRPVQVRPKRRSRQPAADHRARATSGQRTGGDLVREANGRAAEPARDRQQRGTTGRRSARGSETPGRVRHGSRAGEAGAPDRLGEARRRPRPAAAAEEAVASSKGDKGGLVDVSAEELGSVAVGFVEGVVRSLGMDAAVQSSVDDEGRVEVRVEGQDVGLLVGPRGATLAALQELARTVVQRRLGGDAHRVVVDVGGYRARRRAALEAFARRVAEDVQSSGVARRLEPMSPADRKVVHDAVKEVGGVETSSEGEEPYRFVVIRPRPAGVARASAEGGPEVQAD